METVIILIMLMVGLSYVLKLTFMRPRAMFIESALLALFIILSVDAAAEQSKTQIADWLQTPELMLDVAVILTVDVALQIAFCFCQSSRLLLYVPGLLIFPTLFYLLVNLIFTLTGTAFNIVGYSLASAILIGFPLISFALKALIPDRLSRLELIFYLNCIIAMLGVVATVNGHTVNFV